MASIRWTGEGASTEGARERAFTVDRDGVSIPGLFWHPDSGSGPQPLILMGHGGGGHKRDDRMVELGNMFAREYGWCAAAIDGPGHGDRVAVRPTGAAEYSALWQEDEIVDETIEDWRATLDMLERLGEVDAARVGFWGSSMGTLFGIPYVASDDRVVAAVLSKAGMTGSIAALADLKPQLAEYAPQIEIPVLCSMQWDDELFDRAGQLDLFDRIGSEEKRLQAYPGGHTDDAEEVFEMHAEFLERQL